MSHLDEGTLHALLDGELELNEVREIQAHLGSCSACGTRLQSVKEVLAESDRLVTTLQFPGIPRRPAALDPEEPIEREVPLPAAEIPEPEPDLEFDAPAASDHAAAHPHRRPERGFASQPVYDEPPPVLLVPDDSAWAERRRRLVLGMRWAALVLVAVGAGFLASEVRRTGSAPPAAQAARDEAPVTESAPSAVLSEEEASGPQAPGSTSASPRAAPPAAATPAPEPLRRAATPAPASRASERQEPPPAPEQRQTEEPRPTSQDDYTAATDEEAPSPADVRTEAAEALAELDRQRRRDRAAAATAALDSAAERRALSVRTAANGAGAPAAATTSPAPAPAPRTLEQRSGIYLRIGLDEAARQLGRPVHVLEGMQQQFMGLAQGSASPGADASRPVVRVVYQDNQGRMILLDQQRIRPGQTWGSADTRWVIGEIGVALLGEPGPQILRNLRPRVR